MFFAARLDGANQLGIASEFSIPALREMRGFGGSISSGWGERTGLAE
jgi:hypothetical protein